MTADREPREADERGASRARALAGGRLVGRRLHATTILVVAIVLAITALLVVVARVIRDNNEDRLLRQRAHEVATVTEASISTRESRLMSAATLAETTNGAVDPFRSFMDALVGKGQPYVSASLWSLGVAGPAPIAVVGKPPSLQLAPRDDMTSYLHRATTRSTMTIRSMLDASDRRLGYAYTAGPHSRFAVYVETSVPKHRRARIASDASFSELDYAIYLGTHSSQDRLLASSSGHGIAGGERKASVTAALGDTKILLVVTPDNALGGGLLALLPWILLGIGLVAAAVAGVLTEYLIHRREHAEVLADRLETMADENRELYTEQREVAATLQRSLLPKELPTVAGLRVAARYEAGVAGTEVGGDWYDLLPLTRHRLLFSVGDVSGRGLEAAATMASLRYSMRAYALEGTPPEGILHKLTLLLNVGRNELFATVVCGLVDTEAGTITVSRAGHPDLLAVEPSGAHYFDAPLGPAIGLFRGHRYRAVTVPLVPGATYLSFTDGLVERRDEHIEIGLERLRKASEKSSDIRALVVELVEQLAPDSTDDIALLALQWTQAAPRTATDEASTDDAPDRFRLEDPGHVRVGSTGQAAASVTEQTPMDTVQTELPSTVDAPMLARAFLRTALATWRLDGFGQITELLASELVSNVVVHVGAPMTVRITRGDESIRVEVEDANSKLPELRHPSIDEEHGRGVLFVSEMASDWGAERNERGKIVWFELDTTTAAAELRER